MTLSRRYSAPPPRSPPSDPINLGHKYENHGQGAPIVGVIGVGYVGLSLVMAFARLLRVIAFDISESRIQGLRKTHSSPGSVTWTSDPTSLHAASHVLIAVPTLVSSDGTINTAHLQGAIRTVELQCKPGSTIVVESSVAVGMTRRMLAPSMQALGFRGGMSPERVDPGRTDPPFTSIPKVISGLDDITPGSLQSIRDLYGLVFETLVPVSRPEVAEMTKLYENCQRMICITYANEMADACRSSTIQIDPYEVASAAATKPFGYLPMYPGLGVGGHCIPVNPHYLFSTHSFPLLETATHMSESRPADIADGLVHKVLRQRPWLGEDGGNHLKALVAGLAFKRGQSLIVNSPGVKVLRHLYAAWGASCSWYDPLVEGSEALKFASKLDTGSWRNEVLERFDLVIVAMNQEGVNLEILDGLKNPLVERFCKR